MQLFVFFLTLFTRLVKAQVHNHVGWFLKGNTACPHMNVTNFPYDSYTHILISDSGILVNPNGTATCDTTDTVLQQFVAQGLIRGKRIMVREGVPNVMMNQIIINGSHVTQYRNNYLSSIKQALDDWYLADEKDYNAFEKKYPMNGELLKQGNKIEILLN